MELVDWESGEVSLIRQSAILGISRSSLYYQPQVDFEAIVVKGCIDKIYTKSPFYGYRRITAELQRRYGVKVNRKRVLRLMREMGIEAIYPKRKPVLSNPEKQHRIFPYLLKGLEIKHPNQVWGTDITYIPLEQGFAYLVVMMDWFSRYIVSWQMSPSLHIEFCLENLERALKKDIPHIHNSDQGSHFTSPRYTDLLMARHVQISMDGRGRCMDNIFTERLWRTIKYENVYIKSYRNYTEAKEGLSEYIDFYNNHRPHTALENHTPHEVFYQKITLNTNSLLPRFP